MFMKRDAIVAGSTAVLSIGVMTAMGQAHGLIGSSTFDWNNIKDKPNARGSVRSVMDGPTATLDNLEMHITTLNPGERPHPPHRHPNEELIIIRQGTVETLSKGKWIRVGPGSIIFNGSNDVHDLRNVGSEPAVYHVMNWRTSRTPAGGTIVFPDGKP